MTRLWAEWVDENSKDQSEIGKVIRRRSGPRSPEATNSLRSECECCVGIFFWAPLGYGSRLALG